MSPIGTVFHRVQVSSLADSGISLQFRSIPENVRVPIDRLRFLAIKEVQEELQLSKKAVVRLKPVLEMLETFELEDRWESNFKYGKVIVHSVRESAIENVKRFSDQLAVIEGGEFLTTKQLLRLEQIRLRFRCLGLESTDYPLPGKSIREKLRLTPAQETAIREIVETELGDVLKLGTQIDDIGRVLSADQREILQSCFKPLLEHKTLDALSLAQCQDELMQQPTPDSKEADWPPILVQRAVLTLFGQLAPDNVYLERGAFTAPFPWRRIISQIESGGLEWLELSDAQREELLGLKHSEDGSVQYYGRDVYVSMMGDYKPEADWTLEQLKRWKDRFREACTSSDEKLGDRIKEILLPRQLDLFRSAVII